MAAAALMATAGAAIGTSSQGSVTARPALDELYLNRGRANGKQIVPAYWVRESFVPRTRSLRSTRLYGYGWWMRQLGGHQTCCAWGYGGQFVFVVPNLDMVVMATSSANPGAGRHSHPRAVHDLVEGLVIRPAAREGS